VRRERGLHEKKWNFDSFISSDEANKHGKSFRKKTMENCEARK
jgi:hypothetical protein